MSTLEAKRIYQLCDSFAMHWRVSVIEGEKIVNKINSLNQLLIRVYLVRAQIEELTKTTIIQLSSAQLHHLRRTIKIKYLEFNSCRYFFTQAYTKAYTHILLGI